MVQLGKQLMCVNNFTVMHKQWLKQTHSRENTWDDFQSVDRATARFTVNVWIGD